MFYRSSERASVFFPQPKLAEGTARLGSSALRAESTPPLLFPQPSTLNPQVSQPAVPTVGSETLNPKP